MSTNLLRYALALVIFICGGWFAFGHSQLPFMLSSVLLLATYYFGKALVAISDRPVEPNEQLLYRGAQATTWMAVFVILFTAGIALTESDEQIIIVLGLCFAPSLVTGQVAVWEKLLTDREALELLARAYAVHVPMGLLRMITAILGPWESWALIIAISAHDISELIDALGERHDDTAEAWWRKLLNRHRVSLEILSILSWALMPFLV